MKTKMILFLLACFCLNGLSARTEIHENASLVTFKEYSEPLFPVLLKSKGIFSGFVDILVDINEDGTIEDWLPLNANHPDFIRAIEHVVGKWSFEPPMRDGKPQAIVVQMTFNFSFDGVVLVSGNISEVYLNRLVAEHLSYNTVAKLSELDAIPEPIHIVQPLIPSDMPEEEREGSVVVTFFIDQSGNVRIPIVTEMDSPRALAASAFMAIREWKFKPPTVRGQPVVVKARQPFHFEHSSNQVQD